MSHRTALAGRRKRATRKGINFCLMVCGASGSGRTTFINTLCNKKVLEHQNERSFSPAEAHLEVPVEIKRLAVELELGENAPKIFLTVVDTPGFGDLINNEASFATISGYIEDQYDHILTEESKVKRDPEFQDNRVHVLLYFIVPTGHGLRELDIQLMQRLSHRVNVIPVIGKADSLTAAELAESKKLIMEDIEANNILIYNFPYNIEEDDVETIEENSRLRSLLPFAIVGSDAPPIETKDGPVRARQYPWGCVEVDNPDHCDFAALRSALFESHLTDLREITTGFLYENYRTEKLSQMTDAAHVDISMPSDKDFGENARVAALSRTLQEQIEHTKARLLELQAQCKNINNNANHHYPTEALN